MDETNPTARALRCLELLQDHPGITADRLARSLGCSSRAARRYVAVLREAGVPVRSTSGPYGGYRLGHGVRPTPVMFSAAEALALVMAVLDGHHDAGDESEPVGAALGKVVRALPDHVAAQVEAIRRTTAPARDPAAARPDPATTVALVRASSARRRVRMSYRSEAGTTWRAEVEPWAVVVRHGRWYLLCRRHRHGAEAVRAYRLDRTSDVEELDGEFDPPPGLDPVTALEAHLATGWEYAVDVRLALPEDRARRSVSPALGRLAGEGDGRTRLTGSTSNPAWYAEQLAALSGGFEVVGGPELRAAVTALGRRLLAATQG